MVVLGLALPALAARGTPERWGVVIGIGAYKNSKIPALRFAKRDAEAVYDFLVSPAGGGVPADHCLKLIDDQARVMGTGAKVSYGIGRHTGPAGGQLSRYDQAPREGHLAL